MNEILRLTTSQLADRVRGGARVLVNGQPKSYLQLQNMKGKSYRVEVLDEKTLSTINNQTI